MKKFLAEFTATFALILFGTGSIIIDQEFSGVLGNTGIALAFGSIVAIMIYAFGALSGAHMNPAVSIAFSLSGHLDKKLLLHYLSAQLSGAIAASVTLHLLFTENKTLGLTTPSGTEIQSFVLELILTFFLMLTIFRLIQQPDEKTHLNGLIIGGVIFLEALVAGPVCGASMNPFRSLSPAIVSGNFNHLWIYLSAPLCGALLAIPANKLLSTKN